MTIIYLKIATNADGTTVYVRLCSERTRTSSKATLGQKQTLSALPESGHVRRATRDVRAPAATRTIDGTF